MIYYVTVPGMPTAEVTPKGKNVAQRLRIQINA